MLGLIAPEAVWVNPPDAAITAGYKMLQHSAATALGFATPATLYSNDPRQIRDFVRSQGGEVVYKPLRGLPWRGEESIWMSFTSRLTEDKLVEDDLLRNAPGIYQQLIPKAFELRVTVMGDCILTAKIESQDTQHGTLDWRRAPEEIKACAFELPSEVDDLCLRLMARLGIVFGCFDFIVTPEGDHIFLEVNEAGQFLFLEQDTGLPLLDRFSDFLLYGSSNANGSKGKAEVSYADVLPRVRVEMEKATALHCLSPDSYSNDDRSLP